MLEKILFVRTKFYEANLDINFVEECIYFFSKFWGIDEEKIMMHDTLKFSSYFF